MKAIKFVVFLDRDGTINREKGLINDPLKLDLEPLAGQAIRSLNLIRVPVVEQPARDRTGNHQPGRGG